MISYVDNISHSYVLILIIDLHCLFIVNHIAMLDGLIYFLCLQDRSLDFYALCALYAVTGTIYVILDFFSIEAFL